MTTLAPPASLRDNVEPLEAGAHVLACGFPGDAPALLSVEGELFAGPARHRLGKGMLTVARIREDRILAGDDQGSVIEARADGHAIRITETLDLSAESP